MRLSIQKMQLLAAALIATSCLLLASLVTFPSINNYLKFRNSTEEFGRYDAALKAVWAISAERGPSNNMMGRIGSEAELRAALAKSRLETDEKLAQLQAAFPNEFREQMHLPEALEAVRTKLAVARDIVDRVSNLPEEQRNGTNFALAINAMFAAAESGQLLRDAIGRIVVNNAPIIGLDIIMVGAAGTLRDRIGRLGSYVVISLDADDLTKARYRATFETELQRVMSLKTLLKTYAAAYLQTPEVQQALENVEADYFEGALRYAEETLMSGNEKDRPAVEIFSKRYLTGMKSTGILRDLLVQTIRDKTSAEKNNALTTSIMSSLLALISISAMGLLAFLFRKRLFVPMLSAREQIMAIANGDLADCPHSPKMAKEMTKMFHGLDFLREQLRHKQSLEQEREEMASQLWKLARTDPLTGAFNRRALEEVADYIFTGEQKVSTGLGVMIIDIDHFKSINDRFGHAEGDLVLQRTAEVLGKNLRDTDILARFGGEEFVIILQDVNETTTNATAERLRLAIASSASGEIASTPITASFGVVWRDAGSATQWDQLMAIADERLYQAKREGRNRVAATSLQAAS